MHSERILSLLHELCGMPSVTESPGEIQAAQGIADMLLRMDYFKKNPGQVIVHDIEGDARGRRFTTALLRGGVPSPNTVILYGHFDVVGVSEFGAGQDLAFDPEGYTDFLRSGALSLDEASQRDLDSGEWLFGRGVCDMKFGIASCMELLEQAAADIEHFAGNLLLLTVCDEEGNSAGMLGSLPYLKRLRDELGLVYKGIIVTEPYMTRESDPENVCRLHTGSTGKLLPLFYCVGRSGHVLDPYGCLSPNLLTAKIVQKLEQNSDFCDRDGAYFAPAPLCLKQADTKDSYTVQIPVAAYTYFNYMTYRESPASVMERMLKLARDSFCEVLSELSLRREAFERLSGQSMAQKPRFAPKVLTWGQLYELCLSAHGPDFQKHMEDFVARSTQTDLRELTVSVLAEAHRLCPDRDPMIIVCLAPPYYPNSPASDEGSAIAGLCRHLCEFGRTLGVECIPDPTFDGLSDMSYMNIDPAACACDFGGIFPLWGSRYTVPVGLIRELSLPMLALGARGRDLHCYTERLHLPFSLHVAAPMLREAVFWLLSH